MDCLAHHLSAFENRETSEPLFGSRYVSGYLGF